MIPAPDIFIVGAQKAGTTTLTAHLAASPAVVGTHPSLECTYYASAEEHALGGDAAAARYFPACVTSECQHVHLAKNVDVLPDTDAHGRLHGGAPDVRLVCVLRNPVDRAYSAYLWARAVGLEGSPDFATALERHGTATIDGWPTHGNYLLNGRYCEQLEALECTFPRNRMHIVFFDRPRRGHGGVSRAPVLETRPSAGSDRHVDPWQAGPASALGPACAPDVPPEPESLAAP